MRLSRSIVCTGFVVVLSIPAMALSAEQSQPPAPAVGNAISQAIKTAWDGAKRNLTESAAQMPEPDYAFKPTEQVRTFGQILAPSRSRNVFVPPPKVRDPVRGGYFEKTPEKPRSSRL